MIKLQEFARQQGVTDRAIQKHLKKYSAELDGLFERRGPNGTWLTDEACEILRSKMKTLQGELYDQSKDLKIKELEDCIADLKKEIDSKKKYILALEAARIKDLDKLTAAEEAQKLLEEKRDKDIEDALEKQRKELDVEHEGELIQKEKELTEEFEKKMNEERTRKLDFKEAWRRFRGK